MADNHQSTDNKSMGDHYPAREWYKRFSVEEDCATAGHFARDPPNAYTSLNNPSEKVVEDARRKAENLGLVVFECRREWPHIESVKLRAFDPDETTLVEIMIQQGIPDYLHEWALYERTGETVDG